MDKWQLIMNELQDMTDILKNLNDKPMSIETSNYQKWVDSIDWDSTFDKNREEFVDWIYEQYHCTHEDQAMRIEEAGDAFEDFVDGLPEEKVVYWEKTNEAK